MPDEQRVANNSQTYVADADTFQFETLNQENGQATVIRFRLEDPRYQAGDVLVNAIKSNVDRVADQIQQKAQFGSLASSVRVVKAYYDLDSGKVEWLKQ